MYWEKGIKKHPAMEDGNITPYVVTTQDSQSMVASVGMLLYAFFPVQ